MKQLGLLFLFSLISSCMAASVDGSESKYSYWDGDKQITISKEKITKSDPYSGNTVCIPLPSDTVYAVYGEGECWALERTTTENPPESQTLPQKTNVSNSAVLPFQRILHSKDFVTWQEFGRLEGNDDVFAAILVPLKNGKLFLSSSFGWHYFGGAYSPFYIVANTTNCHLICVENVNLDLGLPFSPKNAVITAGRDFEKLDLNRKYLICNNLRFEYPKTVFRFDNCFVLSSLQLGVFWKFNLDGHLEKRMQIFQSMDEDAFKTPFRFERAVLSCQVTPEHSLVVVSRTKEAVWFKQQFYPTVLLPGNSLTKIGSTEYNEQKGNELFPDIEYHLIDLDEGEVIPLATPLNAPSTIQDIPRDDKPWFEFQGTGVPVFVVRPSARKRTD